MTYTNFQIKKKNKSLAAMIEIVDSALRAINDFFKIWIINSLNKTKIRDYFIMSKSLFGVAQLEQNEKKSIIIIIKRRSGSRKSCFQSNILF